MIFDIPIFHSIFYQSRMNN